MGQSDEKLSFGNPIIIVSIYLVIGIIWIFFSDVILAINIRDMPSLIFFQSFKGILYILSTSIVIYYLINLPDNVRQAKTPLIETKTAPIMNAAPGK